MLVQCEQLVVNLLPECISVTERAHHRCTKLHRKLPALDHLTKVYGDHWECVAVCHRDPLLKIDTEQNQTKDQKKKKIAARCKEIFCWKCRTKPKQNTRKKNLQETAERDDGSSHTENDREMVHKNKRKREKEKGKRTRANVLEPE